MDGLAATTQIAKASYLEEDTMEVDEEVRALFDGHFINVAITDIKLEIAQRAGVNQDQRRRDASGVVERHT